MVVLAVVGVGGGACVGAHVCKMCWLYELELPKLGRLMMRGIDVAFHTMGK